MRERERERVSIVYCKALILCTASVETVLLIFDDVLYCFGNNTVDRFMKSVLCLILDKPEWSICSVKIILFRNFVHVVVLSVDFLGLSG